MRAPHAPHEHHTNSSNQKQQQAQDVLQDSRYIYIAMELVSGGELFTEITTKGERASYIRSDYIVTDSPRKLQTNRAVKRSRGWQVHGPTY